MIPILVRSIKQKSSFIFSIEWSDAKTVDYRLSELQKQCPCAKCIDSAEAIDPDVRAIKITSVGRYALRIQFTSGCSSGIYRFEMLHSMGTSNG